MTNPATTLEYTGERMVPELAEADTFWEHAYRYRFAKHFVRSKRVLDIACGEGYGSFSLGKAAAASVVGVDICEKSVLHAIQKYGVDARCGSATAIPLDARSVDVVVSFETLEHIEQGQQFVSECARVLDPNGTLIISTPNSLIYSATGSHNPFHCRELSEQEFVSMLTGFFKSVAMYSQSVQDAGWWSVRSLSASRSRFRDTRGYWGLRRILGASGTWCRDDHVYREHPELAVSEEDSLLPRIVSPYQVRPRSRFSGEQPLYLIAVCRLPKVLSIV